MNCVKVVVLCRVHVDELVESDWLKRQHLVLSSLNPSPPLLLLLQEGITLSTSLIPILSIPYF